MARVYIGLGTNLGDREDNLRRARTAMAAATGITLAGESGILETDPIEYTDQPRFLNQVVAADTTLAPADLLALLKTIERELGRRPGIPKGPRIIDLDILIYETLVLDTPGLTIPHPAIANRPFVLAHLVELAPSLADPATGKAYAGMLSPSRP